MNTKLAITGVIISALLVPAMNAAAEDKDQDRSRPVTYVKDSSITVKVKAKLAAEKLSSLATIHVDTDAKGIVWLSGTARSQEQIDKAVSIARATENVVEVKNQLTVKKDD